MNADAFEALAARWREEAELFRRRGLTDAATMADSYADELADTVRTWSLEALTLADAVAESGLAYSTLQQRIAAGTLPNAGTKGAPRIRRRDLPRRGTVQRPPPDGPDVAAEVLARRHGERPELVTYSAKQAAKVLGVNVRTLANWRVRGYGPQYVKVGARVRYRGSDLEAYLADRTRKHTSDPGR